MSVATLAGFPAIWSSAGAARLAPSGVCGPTVGSEIGTVGREGRHIPASGFLMVPWPTLFTIAVGVPLIAAVAWIFARSRVPLTRRTD